MRPIWLIEANVPGLPAEQLEAEVRRQGMQFVSVKLFPGAARPRDILGSESVPLDACAIFIGTIPLMRHIRATRRWVPGGWCTFENFACSAYYAYFGEFLLNRHYTLLPAAEAVRLEDTLFAAYGQEGHLFVRPDAASKSFTGKIVDRDSFSQFLAPLLIDPTTLVVIARPKRIAREWRLVVAHSQVVAASQYCECGTSKVAAGCPEEVRAFANQVLARLAWRPDPLFMLDVCESDDGLRVLELNGFSCASLYQCDVQAVVEAASRYASLSW